MSSKLDGHYVGAFPGNPYEQPLGDIALIVQPLLNAETPALVVEGLTNFTRNIANSLTNSYVITSPLSSWGMLTIFNV